MVEGSRFVKKNFIKLTYFNNSVFLIKCNVEIDPVWLSAKNQVCVPLKI